MDGDVVVVHRVLSEDDVVFADELARLAAERGLAVHYVVGDHATAEGRDLLSPAHLRELVPDIAEREVYLCGPPAMIAAIERNLRPRRRPPAPSARRAFCALNSRFGLRFPTESARAGWTAPVAASRVRAV